nr:PREDICTED: uncharacterized protein LOC105673301 [Linepithema humile]
MIKDQPFALLRNGHILSTNSCNSARQNAGFNLEKYDPYLDKIRALFVPSLEHKVHSLLEEFVYSEDSRWTKRFSRFKKFINAIIVWKDCLNAEYDMEELIKTVKCIMKDELAASFLDSILLHRRLNKICHELDTLGIEDDILGSFDCWMECNHFVNPNTAENCNTRISSAAASYDAKGSTRCEKDVESLATSDVYRDGSTEPTMTSEYRARKHQQVFDSNENSPRRGIDNPSQSARDGSQNNDIIKMHGTPNENVKLFQFRDVKLEKVRNSSRLKIVIRWRYLEDRGCPTLSRSVVARIFLPCKPSDLMKRIFTADPSLTESCLIVMKRKFEISIRNVCSCLNDVLGNLDVAFIRKLRLDCKIHAGYISFKLKIGDAGNKCLFVTRVPICQNVRKRAIRQDFVVLACNSKLSSETKKSKCFKQCENDDNNDALARLDEKSEKLDDIRCSKLHRSLVKDTTIRASQNKEAKSSSEDGIVCTSIEDVSKCKDVTISCCGKLCENIAEEISDITLYTNNSEEKNAEYCRSLNSKENDYDAKCGKEAVDSLIAQNDESTRSVNDINCRCWSHKNFIAINNEAGQIFPTKNLDSFSQTADINEYDWICSSESNRNEDCNANTCSIATFVQNSERDKQLVELNCNRLSSDDVKAINKQSEDDNSLAKTEIECDSSCSCRYTDFINITVIDNTSEKSIVREASRDVGDALEIPSTNFSKTVLFENNNSAFVRAPKLKISSKDIDVDVSCSRTITWLASGDDRTVSTIAKMRDSRDDTFSSTRAFIVPRKEKRILDRTNFVKSPNRLSTLERIRSSDIPTESYFCAKNHVTPGISRKSHKLRKSKFGRCGCSSNGIDNATSATMLKYRTTSRQYRDDDDFVDARTLVMTSFRDSVDRSIEGIKYLRAKLRRVLFKNKVKTKRN